MNQKPHKKAVWHIICLTTPPQISSLGNYALRIAFNLLEQGGEVHLWSLSKEESLNGIHCHFLDHSKKDKNFIEKFEALLNDKKVRRILWFYEPRSYRNLNQKLTKLLSKRDKEKTSLSIFLHKGLEKSYDLPHIKNFVPYLQERFSLKKLLCQSNFVFVTAPYLEAKIKQLIRTPKKRPPIHWLPLQSNIEYLEDKRRAQNIRKAFAPESQVLIGSFGTFLDKKQTKQLEKKIILLLSKHPERFFLCLGRGSEAFVEKIKKYHPNLEEQIEATGELNYSGVSAHIQACDILLQTYPKGVTAKNTSLITALSHEKAILAPKGERTENFWEVKKPVSLYQENSDLDFIEKFEEIVYDSSLKKQLEKKARETYLQIFSPKLATNKILSLLF